MAKGSTKSSKSKQPSTQPSSSPSSSPSTSLQMRPLVEAVSLSVSLTFDQWRSSTAVCSSTTQQRCLWRKQWEKCFGRGFRGWVGGRRRKGGRGWGWRSSHEVPVVLSTQQRTQVAGGWREGEGGPGWSRGWSWRSEGTLDASNLGVGVGVGVGAFAGTIAGTFTGTFSHCNTSHRRLSSCVGVGAGVRVGGVILVRRWWLFYT
jgi:hypothetical protein